MKNSEHGIETIEWIALAAVILALLAGMFTVFTPAGQELAASIFDRTAEWVARWSGNPNLSAAAVDPAPNVSKPVVRFPSITGPSVGIPSVVEDAFGSDESNFLTWLLSPFTPKPAYAPTWEDDARVKAKRQDMEEKYGIEIRDSDSRIWTEKDLEWLDEALGQLPSHFWGKSSLEYIKRVEYIEDDRGKIRKDWGGVYRSDGSGDQWIELPDAAFRNLWGKSKKGFVGTLAHEATHSLQYYNLETGGEISASANPLMLDYARQFGWVPPQSDFMCELPSDSSWDQWSFEGEYKDLPGYDGFWDGRSIFQFWKWGQGDPTADDIYALTNPKEDMAEAVRLYVTDPDALSEGRKKWIEENLWNIE